MAASAPPCNAVIEVEEEIEELKAEKKKAEADQKKLEAEKDGLVRQWETFMTHMSVKDDFSLRQLLQSPEVEQWKKDYFVNLEKKLGCIDSMLTSADAPRAWANARLATAWSRYSTFVTMEAKASLKRSHESTGATPRATRVRASSPRIPVPTGVPRLHQTSEEHSSQALSAQARDVYKMLEVGDFTFDHDFDNEDDYIHEPLTEVRQRCAETLELAVLEYIFSVARDLFPVRCNSSRDFLFDALYKDTKGTPCLLRSVPGMLVFRRTDELPVEMLSANTCWQHKPLVIEVQSGSRTLEESKVRLATTLFSLMKSAYVDLECVYGIVVEKSLERIHVVRFKSGKYETDRSLPARCLVDICRKVLRGAG